MNKTRIAYIATSLIALSYMYYKLRPIQVIIREINFDALPYEDESYVPEVTQDATEVTKYVPEVTKDVPEVTKYVPEVTKVTESETSAESLPDAEPLIVDSDSESVPDEITCIEPLRVDKELLSIIGQDNNSGEIIYNICEIVTLLDAYLTKENLITNQVITINDKLDRLLNKKIDTTMDYNLLVNELLAYHTNRY